jgi:hypothetical protein
LFIKDCILNAVDYLLEYAYQVVHLNIKKEGKKSKMNYNNNKPRICISRASWQLAQALQQHVARKSLGSSTRLYAVRSASRFGL